MQLSSSLRDFAGRQTTVAVADVALATPEDQFSPYGRYWYRAVACLMLSGRVAAKDNGEPNRTDATRVCKEANFNQYFFDRIGRFLAAGDVVRRAWGTSHYEPGPNYAPYWEHDVSRLRAMTRAAVLKVVHALQGRRPVSLGKLEDARLIEFLTLFFRSFAGRALREDEAGGVMRRLAELPAKDLSASAKGLKLGVTEARAAAWQDWLDEKGQKALLSAVYLAEWAYVAEREKTEWVFPSPVGLAMLGLGPLPGVEPLPDTLTVQSDLSVFAGAGLPLEKLIPLFRHCRVGRIDRVFRLHLDRKLLKAAPADHPPGEELREVFPDPSSLPPTVADLLEAKPVLGGVLEIRGCSAVVKPPSPEVLDAIRKHPRLKNYLETKPPPGYLLIKANADPLNFIARCRELGFEVRRV